MEDLTRTQPNLERTQPIELPRRRPTETISRSARLTRFVVFGLAILVGTATLIVLATKDDGVALRNPSRLYSPSGHLPGEPSDEPLVSMSWTSVEGAAGYWWAVVEDDSDLPSPTVRPSGNDRRVFFRFSGRGYFALRTAFRVDGRLRWSEALLYGPIVVRDEATDDAVEPSVSPGAPAGAAGSSSEDAAGEDGGGGSPSGAGGRSTPVDPRFAGEPGGLGTGSGQPGGPGGPGQPASEPGSGNRPSNDAGTPGRDGPDGGPGPD